jgi:N6-L-threonylcarbamoyladenine synthase
LTVLGIETSCDECAAAVVEGGKRILSSVVATQVPFHEKYRGVVPELASRMHVEWIQPVVAEALEKSGLGLADIDGIAVTVKPGLIGSLLVGLQFAKGLAWASGKPWVGVNHILAHLYAPQLEGDIGYPFLGLLVSGGHTIICRAEGFDRIEVMGTTIDDAVGEAFDKVASFYDIGYPGGIAIDKLSREGDPDAYRFPLNKPGKGDRPYDVSYSGLKTAVINQRERFRRPGYTGDSKADIAASFQKAAVAILLSRLLKAAADTGLKTIVAGGGVAANSRLRAALAREEGLDVRFPSLSLCADNGAMVAGLGCMMLERGDRSDFSLTPSSRVPLFKRSSFAGPASA